MIGGLISGINSIFAGAKQKRLAKKIDPKDVTYEESPYAKEQLATARNDANARMAGAAQAEKNIYQNQANTLAGLGRNATDASQLLAMTTGVQGQTNEAFNNLGVTEAQNAQVQKQNLNNALQNMTNEQQKVYMDKLRKYQEAYNAKMQLMNAGVTNQANGLNQVGSTIDNAMSQMLSLATGGLSGGLMGGGTSNTMSSSLIDQSRYLAQNPTINYSLGR